jgi:hypothetical protein
MKAKALPITKEVTVCTGHVVLVDYIFPTDLSPRLRRRARAKAAAMIKTDWGHDGYGTFGQGLRVRLHVCPYCGTPYVPGEPCRAGVIRDESEWGLALPRWLRRRLLGPEGYALRPFIVWSRPSPHRPGWCCVTRTFTFFEAETECAETMRLSAKAGEPCEAIVTRKLDDDDDGPCVLWMSHPGQTTWYEESCRDKAQALLFKQGYVEHGADVVITTDAMPIGEDSAMDQWVHQVNTLAAEMDEIAASMHPSCWPEALAPYREKYKRLAASGK